MQFDYQGIHGPDISYYQGNPQKNQYVNFEKMKSAGVSFCIIKAGQLDYADPAFRYNWQAAKRAGIPRAAYWFLDYRLGGASQAEIFWSMLKDDPGEGPLIVDYEYGSGGSWNNLYNFLARLQTISGYPTRRIWIYTGYFYWTDFGPKEPEELAWFEQFPLWIAWYTWTPTAVKIPVPWTKAAMWQKGTTIVTGPDWGVHSLEIDYDEFNGGIEEFKKYFTETIDPDPNQGGNMKYRVIWPNGVARRTLPSTSNSYTGLTYDNLAEVEVVEDNIPDATYPNDPNKKWVKAIDGLYSASNYPDSLGVPKVRMEKIEVAPPAIRKPFSLKVDGFKEFVGELESV